MSINPLADDRGDTDSGTSTDTGRFYVLLNDEGQHSLWPSFTDIPAGWRIIFGEESRELCLEHVEANWTALRPRIPHDTVTAEPVSITVSVAAP
ncbi:MbtH family protein [Streptomyces sp. NPDC047014]|uniref:MbtH family protein n=1 Tax=Streptomyces sp. NPDC047014 TaxID=3155736 RepID=UPI00340F5E87